MRDYDLVKIIGIGREEYLLEFLIPRFISSGALLCLNAITISVYGVAIPEVEI
jgi:hypothetical protein